MQVPKSAAPSAALIRAQLVDGFCRAIEEKGYAATTTADIVRYARVSKRTFYEHFATKDACFLAAYEAEAQRLMGHVASAVSPGGEWQDQVAAAVRAYLNVLQERPALTRTFFLAIHAAGPAALRLRRQVLTRFATLARGLVLQNRTAADGMGELSPTMAMAVVGAINELVLLQVEEDASLHLADLAETAVALVRAVLEASVRTPAPKPKRSARASRRA